MEEEKKEGQEDVEDSKSPESGEIDQEELAKSWEEALKEQEEASKAKEKEEEEQKKGVSDIEQDLKLDLQSILEIPLNVEVIIGETQMPLKDVIDLNPGAIVELDREISDTVDIRVNGKLVAKGEIVTVGDYFGVRIKEIFGKERKDVIGASVNKKI